MTPKNISLISTELKTIHEQISFFEDSLAKYSLTSGDIKDEANLTILQHGIHKIELALDEPADI
jgi:hypothetical protein